MILREEWEKSAKVRLEYLTPTSSPQTHLCSYTADVADVPAGLFIKTTD